MANNAYNPSFVETAREPENAELFLYPGQTTSSSGSSIVLMA